MRPSLSCRVEVIELAGKPVLVVEVPLATMPVGTVEGIYKRRAIGGTGKPECLPYHFHEMQAALAHRGALDSSMLSVREASWGDPDPLEFERFRRFIWESRGQGDQSLLDLPDVELAKALCAVEANHAVRVPGLLQEVLRRFIPTHEVAFQVLRETRVEIDEFFR